MSAVHGIFTRPAERKFPSSFRLRPLRPGGLGQRRQRRQRRLRLLPRLLGAVRGAVRGALGNTTVRGSGLGNMVRCYDVM